MWLPVDTGGGDGESVWRFMIPVQSQVADLVGDTFRAAACSAANLV
ncbi:hypothetical protein [Mesorhizobium sp. 43Arga]